MILDRLENASRYFGLHPDFKAAFEYIASHDLTTHPAGKIVLTDDVYINVDEVELRTADAANAEVHDQYIDIQIPLVGSEMMGIIPRAELSQQVSANAEKDIAFYADRPTSYVHLTPRDFVILFPWDGHMPIIGEGKEKKIVVKVRMK